jgi:ubiquitin-protein ligase
LMKKAKERNSALLTRAYPLFHLIKIFLASRIKELNYCQDPSVFSCIQQSGLNQILGIVMSESSVEDLNQMVDLWTCVIEICYLLCENINVFPLLRPPVYLSADFENFAHLYSTLYQIKLQLSMLEEPSDDNAFLNLSKKIFKICPILEALNQEISFQLNDQNRVLRNQSSPQDIFETERLQLSQWMKSQQFGFTEISLDSFKFSSEVEKSINEITIKNRMRRIRKELAILSNSLPCGIFVRVNENRPDMIKFMIVGPEDTPYANGCFLFDMFLPPEFPAVPPKVNLLTVGDGFRFNPNLYSDGYVCLSLLGTWNGPSWDAETSTILQVLVSIQAMIMNSEPYCNEPAWYSMQGSPESLQYSKKISEATALYAILRQLNPNAPSPHAFSPLIHAWIYHKKDQILAQLTQWDELYRSVPDQYAYPQSEMTLSTSWPDTKLFLSQLLLKLSPPQISQ